MAGEKLGACHGVSVQICSLKSKLLPGLRRSNRSDRILYGKLLFERARVLQQRIELPIHLIAEIFAQEIRILCIVGHDEVEIVFVSLTDLCELPGRKAIQNSVYDLLGIDRFPCTDKRDQGRIAVVVILVSQSLKLRC